MTPPGPKTRAQPSGACGMQVTGGALRVAVEPKVTPALATAAAR